MSFKTSKTKLQCALSALMFIGAPIGAAQPQTTAPGTQRPAPVCDSCRRLEEFGRARKEGNIAKADSLIPALLADGKREDVAEYLVYDRGRCAEALDLLKLERLDQKPKGAYDTVLGALVCEAARLEATDQPASKRLLAEALDKELVGSGSRYQSEMYQNFARQPVLNEAAIRFLVRHELDSYRPGFAIETQIENGRVENVRRLLALGADPNEMHGRQHAALGAALDLLKTDPGPALEITDVLLKAGADPAMLLDFSEEPERTALLALPARKDFNARLSAAESQIARKMPVRLQFYDLEMPYARIAVANRSGAAIVLDSWRDSEGFEYGGEHATFEFRFAPDTQWVPYDFNTGPVDHKCMTRVMLEDGERTLLRVPLDPSLLVESPPGLQLRLRIASAGGIEYLSVPFSLHDSVMIRGMWPRDPSAPESVYFVAGQKIELPPGQPKATEQGSNIAPHARPSAAAEAGCKNK